MVEVSGPRRAEAQPVHTFTVELSQSEIDTGVLEEEAGSAPPPAPPAPAAPPISIETPWYAEDIERLPEASVSLGQLALENFEPFPALSLRPDIPQGSRTGTAVARPPGVPTSHLPGK